MDSRTMEFELYQVHYMSRLETDQKLCIYVLYYMSYIIFGNSTCLLTIFCDIFCPPIFHVPVVVLLFEGVHQKILVYSNSFTSV